MKNFFRIALFTVFAVVVAASTRFALRRWFPSLYGDRKQPSAELRSQKLDEPKPAIATGTNSVPSQPEEKVAPPYPTGHLWSRRGNTVVMSDGSVLSMAENTEREPRLQRIQRYYVDYQGRRMWYRPHVEMQGSGAKGAPVRQDGVPPVVVPAVVPVQGAPGAVQSPVAVPASSQIATPPPQSSQSSWRRDEDGVQRLVKGVELGR